MICSSVYRLFFIQNPPVYITRELQLPLVEFFGGRSVPLAEEKGLIQLLGHQVLEAACTQLVVWGARTETKHLTLSVNVSAQEFGHPEFVKNMLKIIDDTGADPRKLMLEITESVMIGNLDETLTTMIALKARGVSFALDDFGMGYSSLSYLKNLPLDQLKIDRSFVRDVLTDPKNAAIARAVIALGEGLGIAVIAEGVENSAQRDFLASNGCMAYQGFLFGSPGPPESIFSNSQAG
jgi:EAL domain-containing protein (putative c-di-GMP-specific phosphodiesterase class I)